MNRNARDYLSRIEAARMFESEKEPLGEEPKAAEGSLQAQADTRSDSGDAHSGPHCGGWGDDYPREPEALARLESPGSV